MRLRRGGFSHCQSFIPSKHFGNCHTGQDVAPAYTRPVSLSGLDDLQLRSYLSRGLNRTTLGLRFEPHLQVGDGLEQVLRILSAKCRPGFGLCPLPARTWLSASFRKDGFLNHSLRTCGGAGWGICGGWLESRGRMHAGCSPIKSDVSN